MIEWTYLDNDDDFGVRLREMTDTLLALPVPEPDDRDLWPLGLVLEVVAVHEDRMAVRCPDGHTYQLPRLTPDVDEAQL